jgi:uncharacterized protein
MQSAKPLREIAYFLAIVFAWSWTFCGIAILLGIPFTGPVGLLLLGLFGLGPLLAAVLLVVRGHTVESPRGFFLRIVDPRRIPPAWVIAMLVVAAVPPIVGKMIGGSAFEFGIASGAALVTFTVGSVAGIFEEPGWRGYALDRLQMRSTALMASLVLGIFWGAWHLPMFFIEGTYHHGLGVRGADFWMFFLDIFPTSVLATWVYVNTNRSILALVVVHGFGNAVNETVNLQGTESVIGTIVLILSAVVVVIIWGPRSLRRNVR